jgi:hypothetical protein
VKKLKWGETPFDKMDRAQLLLHCQRMYDACTGSRSLLRQFEWADPNSPFWGRKHGSGGRELAKLSDIVETIEATFDHESIYRAFFRYATDLLFPTLGIGSRWHVCDKCGSMQGAACDGAVHLCVMCKSTMRPIVWADLSPTRREGSR